MENPSDRTVQTYRENFAKYLERTPSETLGEFKEWLDAFASQLFEKMDAPRYFRYYTELTIREIFGGLPFEVIGVSQAENGKWLHIIVKVQK
ncbi:MAG TPA: hypothetical protein VMW30_01720 [Candidatus Paceibacterota bacterium]|nr:hypothetical protein [Candidatus Paceibacterota bacterium]